MLGSQKFSTYMSPADGSDHGGSGARALRKVLPLAALVSDKQTNFNRMLTFATLVSQADLIKAAVELERSMLRKVLPLGGPDSARVAANEDLQARFPA